MKINYIVNARIPTEKAHGYQICKMCEEFSSQGVKVTLNVPDRGDVKENAFSFYSLKKNFELKKIKCINFFKYKKIIGARFAFYFQSLEFFLKLLFLKIDKNSFVYTRNPSVVFIFSLRGCEVVYECHDWFSKSKSLSLFLLKKYYRVITTNNYIRDGFLKNGFNEDRVLVVPNGVDLDIFGIDLSKEEAVKKLRIDDEAKKAMIESKVLLYAGSFTTMGESKGIDEILEAISRIEDVCFIAVGGIEKDIKVYEKIAKELSLKKVYFLGRVKQKELAIFQRASDVMLMPFPDKAHYKYHMTPLKMFEYMASGRPIIASNLPSIKEILNKENSLFCRPDDVDDLREKITEIIGNEELVKRISDKAEKDVLIYSWKKRVEKIIVFIKR